MYKKLAAFSLLLLLSSMVMKAGDSGSEDEVERTTTRGGVSRNATEEYVPMGWGGPGPEHSGAKQRGKDGGASPMLEEPLPSSSRGRSQTPPCLASEGDPTYIPGAGDLNNLPCPVWVVQKIGGWFGWDESGDTKKTK